MFGKFFDKMSKERVNESDIFYQIAGRLMLVMSKPTEAQKNTFLKIVDEIPPSKSVRKNGATTNATLVTRINGQN